MPVPNLLKEGVLLPPSPSLHPQDVLSACQPVRPCPAACRHTGPGPRNFRKHHPPLSEAALLGLAYGRVNLILREPQVEEMYLRKALIGKNFSL